LTDELTVSWGDAFSAIFADAARGPLVGYRTDGAGGVVIGVDAGFYSESAASFSATLGTRKQPVGAPGYPKTAYIENVGVHPDIVVDAMTRENLMNRFQPFVNAFTAAILAEISKQ
jgi:C-terminal processing protease CtpA/Prc